ncbi:G1/S-specific cyclin-E2-like isoform X2 [Nelusetta ayraudi]|uniref:G1/S-specific cyclin-E2-like isoform X2 n=1 Tax=Nelusetta ayraudi TaxID=303726 RepID=UPI003F72D796
MTRRRGRSKKRCEEAARRQLKQSNKKRVRPLSKLRTEKTQLVRQGVHQASLVIETSDKAVEAECREAHQSPLLPFRWGSPREARAKIIVEEQSYKRSKSFVQKHPRLQPNMRSVLLDWLIEVSDAYTLHRQTFYLAQDYFDRFMLTQTDVEKGMLQLIGITCLFIASKVVEASQPKLSQMAYVTSGTYYEEEILQMELIILKALGWNLCPKTAISWLTLYLQSALMKKRSDVLEPQLPQDVFLQMTCLLDLCMLHMNSLDFQYNVLAASVLSHFVQQETVEKVSGLSKDAIQLCLNWMTPFAEVAGLLGVPKLREFERVKAEDKHNIQTHTDYLTMLECASKKEVFSHFPTPPNSTEKQNTH